MVRVERASTEDAGQFTEWEQASGTKEFILPCTGDEHKQGILDPGLVYLRIVRGDDSIGFLILALDPEPDSIEFRRIVVAEQGQGIGQLAILAMEHFCLRQLHRIRIWLDVFESNRRAQHIYQKLGYSRFGERTHESGMLFLYHKTVQSA
jgi:diamine N-acetyltransferase